MNAKFERKDGHGKSRNSHGEVMEKSRGNNCKVCGNPGRGGGGGGERGVS